MRGNGRWRMPDSPALSSLTAGPELDMLIWTRVMGWIGDDYKAIPEFSTSIEAAWQVVEKMAEPHGTGHFVLRLECYEDEEMGREWGAWFRWTGGGSDYCQPQECMEVTPSLAICRAALIAEWWLNG